MAAVTYYIKQKIDEMLSKKANVGHTHGTADVVPGDMTVNTLLFQGDSANITAEGDTIMLNGKVTVTGAPGYAPITSFQNNVTSGSSLATSNSVEWRGGIAIVHVDVKKETAGNLENYNMFTLPSTAPTPLTDLRSAVTGNRGSSVPALEYIQNAGSRQVTAYLTVGTSPNWNRFKGDVIYFY